MARGLTADPSRRWLFYVHGRILELQGREATSPDFGRYEYDAILKALAGRGFEVISEVRTAEGSAAFPVRLAEQVRTLRKAGVPAERITVVGASKGGFLTLAAAAELQHPGLSFVVLAGCGSESVAFGPRLRGHILSIYDEPDRFAPSCRATFDAAPLLTQLADAYPDSASGDPERVIDAILQFAVGRTDAASRDTLEQFVRSHGGRLTPRVITDIMLLITAMPEYQLC